ncbi:MAG: DegV family protein [Peptococcaceae bacterium]|jgi:DegV family protein with EDD domain|nr:DegV family protein [Peptococcaceae bacterium]
MIALAQVRIMTDSTCDLTLAEIAALDLRLVPVVINFEDGSYRELVDITIPEFYRKMAAQEALPTTAQPAPGETLAAFTELTAAGDEVISYHISGALSGSVNTAVSIAQRFPPGRVTVVDSRTTSIGLCCMVEAAARAAAAGCGRDEILSMTDYIRDNLLVYFVVDNLEAMRKGGRIGRATAFLGGMLHIRPLLMVQDGVVSPVERIRGKSQSVRRMIEIVGGAKAAHDGPYWISAGHCDAAAELDEYMPEIAAGLGLRAEQIPKRAVGAAIGAHAGAGLLALAYLPWPPFILSMLARRGCVPPGLA